jgi:hypothetical protein
MLVEPTPHLRVILGRRERIEHSDLAFRFDARRGHDAFPLQPRPPIRVFEPPDPQTRRDVSDLESHDAYSPLG